ncbi:transposase [Tropicimonas sediminicola]|uniref:Putative transposase n=1 Tax=Tropicimonas sediminicola TaxID=1031541 RepID=A0A239M954_9RHOB|nr:transposase [Tropicimonas sediminicola]SNT39286.1 putative transposase [Tropicimonas sediminicola]
MRKSRFIEPQIMAVLRQAEHWVAVPELCREHGISTASFFQVARKVWRHGRVDGQPE